MTSFFWSTLLLVATGATARKEFSYDVILSEYYATGCYMTSFFWSTLLLVATCATVATAHKELSLMSSFWSTLLQVQQPARSISMTSVFLEYFAAG